MTDYSKTKIYKIESHLGENIYIGSTAKQYLSQRFQQHKNTYNQWKNGKKVGRLTSYDMFDEYGVDNCKIVLIEDYPCSSKDAKNAREGHYIKTMDCVNKNIIGRTQKEYYVDNKEQIKEKTMQYRLNNKEMMSAKAKKYYLDNKEKMLEKHKQYQENNKEKLLEKAKQYRIRKKSEKINQANQ